VASAVADTVRHHLARQAQDLPSGAACRSRSPGAEPNAETHVTLLERRADHRLYRLVPTPGRTHQLRCHLCGLGIPLVGDPL